MRCKFCNDEVKSSPIKQGDDFYCSLECANQAAGYASEEEDAYFEEDDITVNLYEEYDE